MKQSLFIFLVFVLMLSLCACAVNDNVSENSYNMDHGLDAAQYCLFMNKQINAVLNQVTANLSLAKGVLADNSQAISAAASAKQSLSVIESAKHEIEIMYPPALYEDSRQNTLRLISKTCDDMETYIDAIEDLTIDKTAIENSINALSFDFSSLTAEYSIYYE